MKKTNNQRTTYENIQILALAAVESPDQEYLERRARRDFAILFHVPLTATEDIAMEKILQHLYEYQYERMTVTERAEAAQKLLMTPEERQQEQEAVWRNEDEDNVYMFQEEQSMKKAKKSIKTDTSTQSSVDKEPSLLPDGKLSFDE